MERRNSRKGLGMEDSQVGEGQLRAVGDSGDSESQQKVAEGVVLADQPVGADESVESEAEVTPGDMLRALPAEAERRGSRLVSAQAMQARLFSVYDAAAAAEDALALVQRQLTVTLDRGYYEADEIEHLAAELDALLTLEALDSFELADDGLVTDE
jgi:hypothetical protein